MKLTTYFVSSFFHLVQLLLLLLITTAKVKLSSSFPHQISTPSDADKPFTTVECIDTREDFEFHSWVGNPALKYASKAAELPAKFREKFSDAVNGIIYFHAADDEHKDKEHVYGHANEETTEVVMGIVNESNNFDFFEYPVLANENQFQYYNQSIFKIREFVEDKRPTYIYIKYCAFFTKQSTNLDSDLDSTVGLLNSEHGNKQQVVFITPVKGKNQGNLTLPLPSNDNLVWREECFEIDMEQFFGGNEIEISAHNFHSGDYLFIDQLIFVQGVAIHQIGDMMSLCTNRKPMTPDTSPTAVTENHREILFSTTSLPTETDADSSVSDSDVYSVSTIVPNEALPVSTDTSKIILAKLASTSTTTGRQTPTTSTATTTVTTTATTTVATVTATTTTRATITQAPTTLPATTQTPVKSTTTTVATIITSSPKTSTTEFKPPTIDNGNDARIIATTESDPATDSGTAESITETEIDENYSSVTPFDPDTDYKNSTTTPTPALLTQAWFVEHEVTFYSVLPSLTLLIILGICFIALRERKKGIYIINKK